MIRVKEAKRGVRKRQDSLRRNYLEGSQKAEITDQARTKGGIHTDPFHGNVVLGHDEFGVTLPYGIHKAVGGYSDAPNPGDLLCGALASCLDSTIRIIAERFCVMLTSLEVEVKANVDVRGTLMVDRSIPIGFQSIKCEVNLSAAAGTNPEVLQKLLIATENSCVNLQTLLSGVAVETKVNETEF